MEKQTIPVLLTVSASARNEQGQPEESVKLMMPGTLEKRSDAWLLHYDETLEDEADHSTVTHSVHLQVRPGHVTMLRKGLYSMMTVLEHGKRYEGVYHTPYGEMSMAVYPTQVATSMGPDKGSIRLEYQLDMQGGFVSVRRMNIDYVCQGRPC